MIGKRPQAGRILVAKISGEAEHHAKWRELTADEEAAAVAALSELAGGPEAMLRWIAEGRRRRDAARMPPFSGGLHGRGVPRRSCGRYTRAAAAAGAARARPR